jgi:hypothetical protein
MKVATAVMGLLVACVLPMAGATPPPRWIRIPESDLHNGSLCVPHMLTPVGPCFSRPGPAWLWTQTEGGWNYACSHPDTGDEFSVTPYRARELSLKAVADQIRRESYNPTGLPIRGLVVESSEKPIPGSFRYTYAVLGDKGAKAIEIGYVTPSGWVVSSLFDTAAESADFKQFLASYHFPEPNP